MLRAILGVLSTMLASALMWMSPNSSPAVFWSEVAFLIVGLALLVHAARDAVRYLHPAQRIYRRGMLEREQGIVHSIDAIRRFPFVISTTYDPKTKTVTGILGIRRTWRKRVLEMVLWLANRRLLTHGMTIWLGERLGWTYKGEVDE